MAHPSPEHLRRLLAEELSGAEAQTLADHVNGCDRCLADLERLQRSSATDRRLLAGLLLHPPDGLDTQPSSLVRPKKAAGNGQAGVTEESEAGQGTGEPSAWPAFAGYEILGRVCSGGMGEIYQARQRSTGRVVALKTLLAEYGQASPRHREALSRFRTEIESVSRLHHENVAAIYDVGEQEGRPFYSMEWISGGTLAERLAGKPQPEQLAATWLANLARAVHHIHAHGIIHRDLKPANVLLHKETGAEKGLESDAEVVGSRTGRAIETLKITDFGVARLLDREDRATGPCQGVGTPEYMAPEQAAPHEDTVPIGPAADVYSLGVMLYEMLTGRPPFQAPEPWETLRRVQQEEPVSPRRLRPRLSRDLETICLTCLQKDPRRRYGSALALAEDLERWLAGLPIRARPAGWAARAVKWTRRHPERAGLMAVAAALGVALAAGSLWQSWTDSARYARQLADSASHQLLLIQYAVAQSAQDPQLRAILSEPGKQHGRLRPHLEKTRADFVRWFTRPGEKPPIINWFVMDAGGTILGDSYEDPRSVGKNYRFRDYFAGAVQGKPQGRPSGVYVSRVYESEQDERYKFTVITRVAGPSGALLGASIATDSKLVALDMKQEAAGAMIVGPLDPERRTGRAGAPDQAAEYVVVLHRDYARTGQTPVTVLGRVRDRLVAFAEDPSRREATDLGWAHGSWVNYARVGNSRFVAVVEHPYPWPIRWLVRFPGWSAAGGIMLAALVLLRAWPRRRAKVGPELSLAG